MANGVAIVTGGSRGIGRAIVERLISDGFKVMTCGRGARPDDLVTAADWVQGDVSIPADATRIVENSNQQFGPVSVLVNNAGVQVEKTVSDSSDDDWDHVVGVNCRGVFNMSRAIS